MEYKSVITVSAFAVIFLSALFLFMRNYPSDRWFSVVFIVAGVVLLWCVGGAEAEAEYAETTTDIVGTDTETNGADVVAVMPETDPVYTNTN